MQETIRSRSFNPNEEILESVSEETQTGSESLQDPSQEMPLNQPDDYHLNHPDINEAKRLEEYFKLFDIFRGRNPQMITLIFAGAKSIATTLGHFTMEEANNILGYMKKSNRDKVIRELSKSGWIVSDGFHYRMPGRVRSLLIHIFASLARGELTTAEEIKLITFEAEMAENYGLDEEQAASNITMAFRQLSYWDQVLEHIIQKRSRREVAKIAEESKDIRDAIRLIKEEVSKKKNVFAQTGYDDFFNVTSLLTDHFTQILQMAIQYSREDGKAMGKYISMEMIEETLHEASLEGLASFTFKNFSASKQVLQLREETLQSRTIAFFNNQKELIIDTPAPEPVDIVEEELIVENKQNPLEIFYQEVLLKMEERLQVPMEEVIFEPAQNYGVAMYKTGQLIKLTRELKELEEELHKEAMILEVRENFKELEYGPVETVSECYVRRLENESLGV
ncbi:hypothetical protein [Clostridium aminobutyricum]|uniref:Uncharacterized protein n=1 Tax=Clostridium aminobutyricum TaxID=33953 RepID=A0A939D738_CLOAM|nr:hypothetical protein [Clostridium aminobutyricum]MBN7772639.1 hypothetical protein [Clostridium aminobutyricum]